MKKLIAFLIMAVFTTSLFAQTPTASTEVAIAKWDKVSENLGKIPFDQPVTVVFTVTNVGSIPLQIMGIQRTCNCTVPEWPTKAIQPGASGTVKVVYDAKVGGFFSKTVKVTSNVEGGQTELTITGDVDVKAAY